MSWDVMILNGDGTPSNLSETPKEWLPKPMGDAMEVRQAVLTTLPGVDWSDPAWGRYEGSGFSIEFNVQSSGAVDGIALHIRGSGDPLPAIVGLCSANGWVAFDGSNGQIIDLKRPSRESWIEFQKYRDKVTERTP